MFVKTQFKTIINLAYFERVEVKQIKCERSEELHDYILAKSDRRGFASLTLYQGVLHE